MEVKIIFNENVQGDRLEPEFLGERTYLVLGNYTKTDIHVQVTGDVHTGNWGPHLIRHTKEPQVKSKKVPVGTEATYTIRVWKNAGGERGEEVGSFDHSVKIDLLGNHDRLEFLLVERHGRTHMSVVSWKKAAEIALLIWGSSGVLSHQPDEALVQSPQE